MYPYFQRPESVKTLRAIQMGHQAFLLDVFFGLPCDSDKLEEVFDRPDGGLEISKGISTSVPDLDALRKSRPDQSPSEIGPNVIELCQMADITFMALHGSIGENGKLQATFDNLGIKYTGPNSLGCTLSMNKLVTKQIFKTSGVPTPRGTSLTVKTKDTRLDELGYYLPLVVKPCSNGSSIASNCIQRSLAKPPSKRSIRSLPSRRRCSERTKDKAANHTIPTKER